MHAIALAVYLGHFTEWEKYLARKVINIRCDSFTKIQFLSLHTDNSKYGGVRPA